MRSIIIPLILGAFLSAGCATAHSTLASDAQSDVPFGTPAKQTLPGHPVNASRIFFLNRDIGWANCLRNSICSTSDGGRSWSVVSKNMGNYSFVFLDPLNGWASGHERGRLGKLLRTHDGGRTWTQALDFGASLFSISFSPSGVGLITVWQTGLFRSTDAGQSWTKVDFRLLRPSHDDIQFDPKDTELLTGLHNVAFLNDETVVGYGSGVWVSNDGGASWLTTVPVSGSGTFLSAAFPDDGSSWIFGSGQYLIYSRTGMNWKSVRAPAKDYAGALGSLHIEAASFLSHNEGWVVRDDRMIFHTLDGGSEWKLISQPEQQFREIRFVPRQFGWAVSGDWSLFQTEDGGETWTLQPIKG